MIHIYPLQRLLRERAKFWDPDGKLDLLFFAVELGGEAGEALNAVKKLHREKLGIRGSRTTVENLADELADVVITAANLANQIGVDLLGDVIPLKFNKSSEAAGLPTKWRW